MVVPENLNDAELLRAIVRVCAAGGRVSMKTNDGRALFGAEVEALNVQLETRGVRAFLPWWNATIGVDVADSGKIRQEKYGTRVVFVALDELHGQQPLAGVR